ncbi:MAG: hypothetical protein LBE21_10615 [Pseudomonadales bacterium]|nr:hypothetical protein [Pseudomonadales bacterium]
MPTETTQCDLGGWVNENALDALNVYAEPSADSAIVGTLPGYDLYLQPGSEYLRTGYFRVRGSSNGWLLIEDGSEYRVSDVPEELPDRPAYAGPGWIEGRYWSFALQGSRGYVKPDANSAKIVDFGYDWLPDVGVIDTVLACQDEWVLVDYHLRYRSERGNLIDLTPEEQAASPGRAWFRGVCGILETTCDGVGDLYPEPSQQ